MTVTGIIQIKRPLDELNALMDEIGAKVKAQNECLASHTVLEMLLCMNAGAPAAADVGYYSRASTSRPMSGCS